MHVTGCSGGSLCIVSQNLKVVKNHQERKCQQTDKQRSKTLHLVFYLLLDLLYSSEKKIAGTTCGMVLPLYIMYVLLKLYFCGNVGEAQLRRRGDPQKRKRVQELSSDEEELEGIEMYIDGVRVCAHEINSYVINSPVINSYKSKFV